MMIPRAWVVYPCKEDPCYSHTTVRSRLALVARILAGEIELILPDKPDMGTVLSVQLFHDPALTKPITAEVFAAERESCGDWLVSCKLQAPLSGGNLRRLLGPYSGAAAFVISQTA
jgi:hypothetical protein